MTQRLNVGRPIVNDKGEMADPFVKWANLVSDNLPLIGTGNPDGVIDAPQYSLFIDETVPLVPVQYRKMLPDIGGDTTQGWAAL